MIEIPVIVVLEIIFLHFCADFVLQTDKMALNKSSSNMWLGLHCFVYSVPFLVFGLPFALINGILHFIVDYFSSRICKKLWLQERRHDFFVVVGLDQLFHFICLILIYVYLEEIVKWVLTA